MSRVKVELPAEPAGGAGGSLFVYCCAGMRRSGSTLQAQLVAHLLGGAGIAATSPESFARQLDEISETGARMVLKCHRFIPEVERLHLAGRARIFYCYRDIRDVVASIVAKYSIPVFSFVHGGALSILREYESWAAVPDVYISRYEETQSDMIAEIKRIAAYLNVEVSDTDADGIAEAFSVDAQRARISAMGERSGALIGLGRNRRDAESLLHLNHIRSGAHGSYRSVLRWYQIAALEWVCRDWMRSKGYVADYRAWVQAASYLGYELRATLSRLSRMTRRAVGKP